MKTSKLTRRALLTSIMALMLCFAMLTGTTFAWFTDQETSGNNKIIAGNLDVAMYNALAEDIADTNRIVATTKLFDDIAFWEPGAVAYENITVINEGNLALKYELTVGFSDAGLADVLKVGVISGGITDNDRTTVLSQVTNWQEILTFVEGGELEVESADRTDEVYCTTYGIVLYWEPSNNDNAYNANDKNTTQAEYAIDFGVKLYATQLTAESDAFGSDYDAPVAVPVIVAAGRADTVFEIGNDTIGTFNFVVPKDAVETGAEFLIPEITAYEPTAIYPDNTSETVTNVYSFDIKIDGVKENNTTPITITYPIADDGEDYVGVEVYHNGTKINNVIYDAAARTVTFTTTSFSPYEFHLDTGATAIPASYTNDEAVAMLKGAAAGAKINGNGRVIDFGTVEQNKWALSLTKSISLSNMTLKANGKGQVIIIQGKNQTVKMKNVVVQNTNFSGQSLVLSLNGATSQIFDNCTFKGKAYFQGSNATFVNCSFDKNNNMDSSATNFTFDGCKFTNASAITINAKATNIIVKNCTFSGSAFRIYKGMAQPTNVQLINNTYKGTKLVSPDAGIDYEGWKANGAWIEEGNIKG